MADEAPRLTEDDRLYIVAVETLSVLTRVVFVLASHDEHSYTEIAWRCGISQLDVQNRVADALLTIGRYRAGERTLVGTMRRELLPLRRAWAAARAREWDRFMAPYLSPERRPGRRGVLDWMACACADPGRRRR